MGTPIIRYEAGQTAYPNEAMTDSGDATVFAASFSPLSNAAGYEPVVRPDGLLTGGAVTAGSGNDNVAVAALTCNLAGVVTAVAADSSNAITRPATNVAKINSITVNSSGALAVIAGTDGADANFVETRGAAGGPPYVPVGSIEIAQVRIASSVAAAITAAQIFQVPGIHQEQAGYPVYALDFATGEVEFSAALPLIHTGDLARGVYISGATPLFAPIPKTSDWVPAESTYSITSTDTYDGPVGSASSALGQASFTAILTDGITDGFLAKKGTEIWVEFRPDRDKTVPRQLTQGILGISRTFPAGGGSFSASCTITPSTETLDIRE